MDSSRHSLGPSRHALDSSRRLDETAGVVAILRGPDHEFEFVNDAWQRLFARDVLGKSAREALPEIQGQGFIEVLDTVYRSGERSLSQDISVGFMSSAGETTQQRLDLRLAPLFDGAGAVNGIFVQGSDGTAADRVREALLRSERRFRAAVEAIGFLWTNTADGLMHGSQPGWSELTGQTESEYSGLGWATAIHPEDSAATVAAWQAAVAERRTFVFQHRVRTVSGAWRSFSVRAVPVLEPQGTIAEWVGVHIDITERLAFEQHLQESESRFRNLSNHAPVIWVTRADGHCEHLNQRWLEFTGQTLEDAVGFGWLDAVHPDDAAAAEAAFRRANAERSAFHVEYRLRRSDGEYRWCIDAAAPRVSASGEALGYIGSVIDITDRKRVEAALAAEKRGLELIAKGAQLADVLNAIALEVEGQGGRGMRCSILVLDLDGERLRLGAAPSLPAAYNEAIDGLRIGPDVGSCGRAAYELTTVISPDLQTDPHWIQFRQLAAAHGLRACCSVPIVRGNGVLQGTIAIYFDVARPPSDHELELARSVSNLVGTVLERHRWDEHLRRSLEAEQSARSEAERSSRMKDEFLATLSHELRTPLSSILGWVALLRRQDDLPASVIQGVDVIERNARAQAQIIADLLDMSAIVSGHVTLDSRPVDMQALSRLAIDAVRPTAAAKKIILTFVAEPGESPALVFGDANRLRQVVLNLLSNAIKFTASGGNVELRVAYRPDQIEVRVSDSGEGISAEFLPFVFDRFRQADASTSRRHGGLGLGLSIVKRLVELHEGSVGVESPGRGKGASFFVRVPVAGARDSGYGVDTAPAAISMYGEDHDLTGLHVLLVDDDADGRLATQRLLERAGASVTAAESSAIAMTLFARQRFDVLVSDLGMPDADGYALMNWVRARAPGEGGQIPAVALTAYARQEDRIKAIAVGFQDHLTKPVEADRLLAAVARLGTRTLA
ncbi:MAG: PAS domain S-box protein [Proteobacteria bacterium]|nr:PAS domain S-box protein [Burkholderiales bacterium]